MGLEVKVPEMFSDGGMLIDGYPSDDLINNVKALKEDRVLRIRL